MTTNWTQGIIIIAVLLLVPLIVSFLNKYFRNIYPATNEITKTFSRINKDKILKKKLKMYSNAYSQIGIFTWAVITIGIFLSLGERYRRMHGDNYIGFIILVLLMMASIGPVMEFFNIFIKKIFTIRNPKINPRLYEIYSAFYMPQKEFEMSHRINALEINRKALIISLAIFIPCLILAVIFAII